MDRVHVLAVDDSHLDRKVVERLLTNLSYKVTTVDSALRALEVLGIDGTAPLVINEIKINLIITDYCMPEMTGFDLLKKVKESSALKEIPVVIMSSENVAERVTMCLAEGAKEFILKPLRLADIKRLRTHVKSGKEDLIKQCISTKRKFASDSSSEFTTKGKRLKHSNGEISKSNQEISKEITDNVVVSEKISKEAI